MATFKCNDPIYTVLRNGKVISNNRTPGDAIEGIAEDAARNVCAPECCITAADIALDTFDLTVTTETFTGLSIRITITSGGNTYSTAWEAAGASNTFDLTGLIVEVGGWFNGDTVCVEYSYNQDAVIEACCMYVVTDTYEEDDTYQLSEIVRDCDGSTFDLAYQNPDGGVTVDADGEMVVPTIEEGETVFVTHVCDGCISDLLVLTVTNAALGLRLTFNSIGNVPVVDPTNVGQWNTFFDLPANGTAFTSVSVAGDEVSLVGGAGISTASGLFASNTNLIKIEDDAGCISVIKNATFLNATALTDAIFPAAIQVGVSGQIGAFMGATALTTISLPLAADIQSSASDGNFKGCTSLATLSLPAATDLPSQTCFGCSALVSFDADNATIIKDNCFSNCTSLETVSATAATALQGFIFVNCNALTTIDLSSCTNFGGTTGNDSVFDSVNGATITITVPTVLQTCDGGNPDGDLVYLSANNTATINYI